LSILTQRVRILQKGLVKYYESINIHVTENDINITTGGSEALQIALAVTCNPDDEVIVMEPFYTNYNSFALQNNVILKPITTSIKDGFSIPDPSSLRRELLLKQKALLSAILVILPGHSIQRSPCSE
jgi:aspartate aminotransferase